MTDSDKVQWPHSLPFFLVHLVALATPFLVPISWELAGLVLATYALRMFAITAGYHRYFSHRTYDTSRAFQLGLGILGTTACQQGPLWWAAHHRDHHRWSDTPQDIHSPLQRGFWWSHVGWILSRTHGPIKYDRVKDLARYPELRWLSRYHLVPPILMAVGLFLAGGWPALLWGFFVSTVLLWHGTFAINSLAHLFGRRRYETRDGSRNSFLLAVITLGEGWHNNHHHFPGSVNQGWFWWELDVSYYTLRLLEKLGLVWNLTTPPERVKIPSPAATPGPGREQVAPPVARRSRRRQRKIARGPTEQPAEV